MPKFTFYLQRYDLDKVSVEADDLSVARESLAEQIEQGTVEVIEECVAEKGFLYHKIDALTAPAVVTDDQRTSTA